MATPRLTFHARERCREMGIRTKRVKDIVRMPDLVRTAQDGNLIAVTDNEPDIAVVYSPEEPPVIISVLWRTYQDYERDGQTYLEK